MSSQSLNQSELIKAAGNMTPDGMCFGLTLVWLMANEKNEIKKFWEDARKTAQQKEGIHQSLIGGIGNIGEATDIQLDEHGYHAGWIKSIFETSDRVKPKRVIYESKEDGELQIQIDRFIRNNFPMMLLGASNKNTGNSHIIGFFRKGEQLTIFDANSGEIPILGDNETLPAAILLYVEAFKKKYKDYKYDKYHFYYLFNR